MNIGNEKTYKGYLIANECGIYHISQNAQSLGYAITFKLAQSIVDEHLTLNSKLNEDAFLKCGSVNHGNQRQKTCLRLV